MKKPDKYSKMDHATICTHREFISFLQIHLLITKTTAMLLLALNLVFQSTAIASTTVDLKTGKVPVKDRSSRSLQRASQQSLEQVLVKLTGQQDINEYQSLATLHADANRFLRAYRYTEEQGQLYFVADFDRQQIEQALIELGLPIWGSRRPDGLLWLVVEDQDGNRTLLADDSLDKVVSVAREQANYRGIPLSIPLMDLDDSVTISEYDVWGLFPEPIIGASRRYKVEYVLAARLFQNRTSPIAFDETKPVPAARVIEVDSALPISVDELGAAKYPLPIEHAELQMSRLEPNLNDGPLFTKEEFTSITGRAKRGRYSLDYYFGSSSGVLADASTGTLIGDSTTDLITELIDRYANYLGQNYAILPVNSGEDSELELSVSNLASISTYVNVQKYLQNLSVTESVMLVKQQGNVSTFSVTLLGTEQDLMAILSLDNQLQPLTDAFGQPLEGMHYFWAN